MKKLLLSFPLLLAAFCASARSLTIGIDVSGSNPLLTDERFAYMAATHVAQAIRTLEDGDAVRIKTFGARGDARNILEKAVIIDRRNRASEVANDTARDILSLAGRDGIAQGSTHLLAYLDFTSGFDCAGNGSIIVLTDAVESSSVVNAVKLLEGKAKLPDPDVNLKGCTLTFYGLGAGLEDPQVKVLRSEWTRWAEKAGAQFTAVVP